MKTKKFTTNINCSSCVRTVTPLLNKDKMIANWQVDTDNPDKILTVEGDISEEELNKKLSMVGFSAREIA